MITQAHRHEGANTPGALRSTGRWRRTGSGLVVPAAYSRPRPATRMASGDVLLDPFGNEMLDDDGNVLLDNDAGNDCCCGAPVTPPMVPIGGVPTCATFTCTNCALATSDNFCLVTLANLALPGVPTTFGPRYYKITSWPTLALAAYLVLDSCNSPAIYTSTYTAAEWGNYFTIKHYSDAAGTLDEQPATENLSITMTTTVPGGQWTMYCFLQADFSDVVPVIFQGTRLGWVGSNCALTLNAGGMNTLVPADAALTVDGVGDALAVFCRNL